MLTGIVFDTHEGDLAISRFVLRTLILIVTQTVLESLGNLGSLGIALKELKIKNYYWCDNFY